MDYSKLSDFEINCEVSKLTKDNANNPDSGYLVINDYCNNPADAWPILVENGISLIKCTVGSGYWSAEIITDIDEVTDKLFQCQSSFDYQDANPLRAAMIVYLQMRESANVQDNPA